ncbi:type I-E CRISPR-associated protein Cse1/CasA [Kitasatospora fiedleri]|uniref:type I-E CRISPR-associated protein Cse1/CasA n=1 Tax=Kitasatospora fiedleri TaxID=2991545 RepID=UPI00249C924D|nr:type I-E CRISPR-associated protein Cse1/CasA [Kitasatospora fiedleri]
MKWIGGALSLAHSSALAGPRLGWDPRRQPCVSVITCDGESKSVSLCELFQESEGLAAIAGGTPGETVAIVEFLLAVCFAAGECPASAGEWQRWVAERRGFTGAAAWLARQSDGDWDMFDPLHPLGQNALLRESFEQSATGTAQLVIERAGDYLQFFDRHHLEDGESLSAAEAFRAVLTQHVYAPYGRGRISGEKLGPAITNLATGRLLGRIRVVALGETVGETLRLNLYPYAGEAGGLNTSWTTGSVVRRTFEAKARPRMPRNPADLHSALGRSILLEGRLDEKQGPVVDRVLIGAGEVLELDPERDMKDAVLSRTTAGLVKPLWPSPSRALWQEAHALYAAVKDRQPGLYELLWSLPYERTGMDVPYQLWAVGLIANKTLPVTWVEGCFPYAPGMAEHLYLASSRGSRIAEFLAIALRRAALVASQTVHSAKAPADEAALVARYDARWRFWADAAEPFDKLLEKVADLDPDSPTAVVVELVTEYAKDLRDMAREQLVQRLESLPPNDRGYRARARAMERYEDDVAGDNAPAEIRELVGP